MPNIKVTAIAFLVCSLAAVTLRGQSPCSTDDPIQGQITYRTEALRYEYDGFFPYDWGTGALPSPLTKYRTESWNGGGHYFAHGEMWYSDFTNLVYSGSWDFSNTNFGSVSTKAIHGHVSGSYNSDGPYDVVAATFGLDQFIPGAQVPYITGWGPTGGLVVTSGVSREIVWPSQPLNATSGWADANIHETLSNPFAQADAFARGEANKTVTYVTGMGTGGSRQYISDYYPKALADIKSRTDPVKFPGQRVSARVVFNQPFCCKGKYDLTFVFNRTLNGAVSSKTYTIPSFDYDPKTGPLTYPAVPPPAAGAYISYDAIAAAGSDSGETARPSADWVPAGATWELVKVVVRKSDSVCVVGTAGMATARLGSVDLSFWLGHQDDVHSAGSIRLYGSAVNAALYQPTALTIPPGANTTVVRVGGVPRQVKTPESLADINVLGPEKYTISFYGPTQFGTLDPGTGLYSPTGTATVRYTIENPDTPGTATQLKITTTKDGTDTLSLYAPDSQGRLTLSTGNGLSVENSNDSTDGLYQMRFVKDSSGVVVSQKVTQYADKPFGRVMISTADGQITTNYTYYENAGTDGVNYGRVKMISTSTPNFVETYYEYDSLGRVITERSTFQNNRPSLGDNSLNYTTRTYTTIPDVDGDGIPEDLTTVTRSLQNAVVGRSFHLEYSKRVTFLGQNVAVVEDRTATDPSAVWNTATNLFSRTRTIEGGAYDNRTASSENADGTITLYTYSLNGTDVVTRTDTGAPAGDGLSVVAGTRTTQEVDALGGQVSESTVDIASGLVLSASVVSARDGFNRPTRIDYSDGTSVLRTYACCGVASETDRNGIVTTYGYDALGRQTSVTRFGLTTLSDYDPVGRVTKVRRVGSDSSQIILQQTDYDLTGRPIHRFDPLNRETLLTYSMGIQFTTLPSGLRRSEYSYYDGSAYQTYQDGQVADAYATVVASGLVGRQRYVFNTSTYSNGPLAETDYTDFAGRDFQKVWGDGATEQSYFNALGQLVKTVDADGVATLFAYNSQGDQEVVCVDVDGDGVIGYGTSDRITRTTSHYESRGSGAGAYVVRVTTVERWETAGSSTSRIVSTSETSIDGDHAVNTVNGLATTTTVTRDRVAATWVSTTVAPDGTTAVQSYANGLLQSTNVSNPTGSLQLSHQDFGYDPHQRLATSTDARTGATSYTYFDDDQVHTVTTPDPDPTRTGNGYDPQTTTYAYDTAGRQQTVTLPDGGVVTTAYYSSNLVQRQSGARTTPVNYAYDSVGRRTALTTEGTVSATTTWSYDPVRGWLTAKHYPDGTGPTYDYTPAGRLKHRFWARQFSGSALATTYSYNTAGDLAGIDYADTTPDVTLLYDRVGRPNSTTDASGVHTQAYDLSGQLGSEAYTSGLLTGTNIGRSFDSLSRLSGLTPSSVPSVTYSYDAASRLQTVTSSTLTATYSYFTNSNLINTTTFKNGGATRLTATNVYDNLNRLTSVTSTPSASSAFSYVYTYNNANQRTRATREDASYWDYGYDTLGQVTSGQKKQSAGAVMLGFDFGYAYDPVGNRTTSTSNRLTTTYGVNNLLNQYSSIQATPHLYVRGTADAAATVTVETQPTVRQAAAFDTNVLFDPATLGGTKSAKITAVKNNYGTNGEDLVAEQTRTGYVAPATVPLTYDQDGNLTDDARWHYTWDAENRLIQIETAPAAIAAGVAQQKSEFVYDAQGRRVSKKVSNWTSGAYVLSSQTLFLYDGWNMVVELNALSGNSVLRSYVWGLDLSGTLQGAGGVGGLLLASDSALSHFTAYDGNGNVAAYINGTTGAFSATYEYTAFGETIAASGPAKDVFSYRFSTKLADTETALLYYGSRYYNPLTGRWLSRDPIEEGGGANLYGFVSNSPTNLVDPLGLYDAPGHFDTPYIDAQAAGYSPSDAFKLAYWTQYPDLDPNYDAMRAPSQNRMAVREYLHSLTGGDAQKLREYLTCLLKSGEFKLISERGILLHAFGDTYTHSQRRRNGQERLDGPQIGHLFRGHNADYIASDPAKFGRYVNDMYDVLASSNGGAATNPALRDGLVNAANSLPKPYLLDFFFNGTQDGVETTALRKLPGGYKGTFNPADGKLLNEAEVGPAPNMESMIQRIKNGVGGCCLKK